MFFKDYSLLRVVFDALRSSLKCTIKAKISNGSRESVAILIFVVKQALSWTSYKRLHFRFT